MTYSGIVMHGDHVRDHVEQAQAAERLGFGSAFVTEVQEPDAITVLTAAAAGTERIHIGTGSSPSACAIPTWQRCRSGRSRT